jgi:hypothetical protein
MPQSLQCFGCVHYQGAFETGTHCKAFPSEDGKPIPEDIIQGAFDHREEYLGDNGIRFKSNGQLDVYDDDDLTDMSDQPPL